MITLCRSFLDTSAMTGCVRRFLGQDASLGTQYLWRGKKAHAGEPVKQWTERLGRTDQETRRKRTLELQPHRETQCDASDGA